MRLTQFSNFAVRVLMAAGLHDDGPVSLPGMARAYGISYNHLKKAAAELCRLGYLEAVRGREGGVLLAKRPEEINIGAVIRATEGDVVLVECFDPATNTCPLRPACELKRALERATAAFFAVLDGYTLADLLQAPQALRPLLGLDPSPRQSRDSAGANSVLPPPA